MRYVIYGAGAIGGTIGGRLVEAGHDVALIARGQHLEVLRSEGLRLERPDADLTYEVDAYGSPAEVGITDDDVVILAMKAQHTAEALDALAAVTSSQVPVVCAQNGVESERMALRRFEHVYAMCVMLPADHLEPGVVRAYGYPASGILDLGRYPSGVDETARRITAVLDGSGFSSRPIDDPMRIKYGKLIINLHNALDALGGGKATKGDIPDRVRTEAYEVLKAAKVDVATSDEDAERRVGVMERRPVGDTPRGGGSSWQSLARGTGSIETDYLNGEVVLLGRLHGVPTPINEAIQHEARRAVVEGRPPGSLSVDELRQRILGQD